MRTAVALVACAFVHTTATLAADPEAIDWGRIATATVPLFYPGQSSHEWLVSDAHKGAVKEVRRGDACAFCHDEPDAEKDIGANLVSGKRLEPTPPKGKNGHIDLKVQAAFDDRNAYLRLQWKTNAGRPGTGHPGYRYDGREWKPWGGSRLAGDVIAGRQPAIYEDSVAIMLDDGKVPNFAKQGCWLTCHDGERDMPKQASRADVDANPLLSALKKFDVRKYLPASRNDPADWRSGKAADEIAKLKADGGFADLLQWRAHNGNALGRLDHGHILESRHSDAAKAFVSDNFDPVKKQPRYMFDAGKTGRRALGEAELAEGKAPLIKGINALPFNPGAGWKAGDILPQTVVDSGGKPVGKAAGTWKDGQWTVLMTLPLGRSDPDDKPLRPGSVYNVGFAVHDDAMASRGHHVGWVRTLGLGAKADIEAVKLP